MSKNAELEDLAREMSAMPQALRDASFETAGEAVILARMVNGLSAESWREASRAYSLEKWHAFPIAGDSAVCGLAWAGENALAISPFREVRGALTFAMFSKLLGRELSRINRNGGCLTLVGACLTERRRLVTALGEGTAARLEAILGLTILSMLDDCDSLGILRQGQYICSLPGIGQLAARSFAEKCRDAFEDAARPFFPTGGISAGQSAGCSIGIVNILQGEKATAGVLLKRVKAALELALSRDGGHIYQEAALTPLENTTLVQSSEKRFLFFGGDPS